MSASYPLPKVNNESLDVVLAHYNAVKYTTGVALVVTLYDYLLCLPQEVAYIWASNPYTDTSEQPEASCRLKQGLYNRFRGWRIPWNSGKLLYFFLRYLPIADISIHLISFVDPNLSKNYCLRWFFADSVLSWIGVSAVTALLSIRTAALYTSTPAQRLPPPRSPSIHFAFSTTNLRYQFIPLSIYTLAIISALTEGGLLLVQSIRIDVYDAPKELRHILSGCPYKGETHPVDGVWILLLLFDTVVCFATGWKAMSHYQHGALSHSPLLSTLYTTGFIYFFLILSIAISNITVWFAGGPSLKRLLNIIFRAAMSVGGSRIILELRGVKVGFGSDDLAGIENEDDSRGRSIGLSKFRAGDRIEDVRDNGEYGMDPHEAGVDDTSLRQPQSPTVGGSGASSARSPRNGEEVGDGR